MHKFTTSVLSKESVDYFLPNVADSLTEAWSGIIDHKICEKLKLLGQTGSQQAYDDYINNVEDFNVIIHGDFWCTNILFSYNEHGKVNDAKLVRSLI